MYLLVFVEGRYVASFLAMLMLGLLFAVLSRVAPAARSAATLRNHRVYLLLLLIGCGACLAANEKDADRDVLGHVLHHHIFY